MTSAEVHETHIRLTGSSNRSGNERFQSEALAGATGEKEVYAAQYRTLLNLSHTISYIAQLISSFHR